MLPFISSLSLYVAFLQAACLSHHTSNTLDFTNLTLLDDFKLWRFSLHNVPNFRNCSWPLRPNIFLGSLFSDIVNYIPPSKWDTAFHTHTNQLAKLFYELKYLKCLRCRRYCYSPWNQQQASPEFIILPIWSRTLFIFGTIVLRLIWKLSAVMSWISYNYIMAWSMILLLCRINYIAFLILSLFHICWRKCVFQRNSLLVWHNLLFKSLWLSLSNGINFPPDKTQHVAVVYVRSADHEIRLQDFCHLFVCT
jgi:hypothetical protein